MQSPVLRRGLTATRMGEPGPDGRPRALLRDPQSGRSVQLGEIEIAFVRQLDGTRTFAQALANVRAAGIPLEAERAEQLLEALLAQGLVEDASDAPTIASPPAAPRPPPPPAPVRPQAPPPPSPPKGFEVEEATIVDEKLVGKAFPPAAPPPPDDAEAERTLLDSARVIPIRPGVTPAPPRTDSAVWHSLPPEAGGALPRLRSDLVVRERMRGERKAYEVFDPTTRRLLALYPAELAVARELDGSRSLFALLEIAKDKGLALSPAKLWNFVTMLQQSGFLEPTSDGLDRNEFSVVAPLPAAPMLEPMPIPAIESLAIVPQPVHAPLAAPAPPAWSAEERHLFQVALGLYRRGATGEAENHLTALLEMNPSHKEARTLLEVIERDKQRAMTLADVSQSLAEEQKEEAEGESAEEEESAEGATDEPSEEARDEAAEARGREELRKKRRKAALRRAAIWLSGLGLVLGASAVIPYPLEAKGSAVAEPRDRAVVRAAVDGLIARIEKDEGAMVDAGGTIAVLYDQELRAQLAQRQAEQQQAEAQLAILRRGSRPEEVRAAEQVLAGRASEVALQARECGELRRQVEQRVIPVDQLRACESELASKRAAAAEARAQLTIVSAGARPEEVQAAEARLRRTAADVEEIQTRLDQTVIRSPIAGRVITPRFRERLHERVAAGAVICEVARLDVMRVEIHVPESEMDLPVVGQLLTVRFVNIPERTFQGSVVEIGEAVETETVEGKELRFVRVLSEVPNPDGSLRAGLTGYATIRAGDTTILGLTARAVTRWFRLKLMGLT